MLEYTGNGKYITGIPARDLSDDDLQAIATRQNETKTALTKSLVSSGLYAKPKPAKQTKQVEDND